MYYYDCFHICKDLTEGEINESINQFINLLNSSSSLRNKISESAQSNGPKKTHKRRPFLDYGPYLRKDIRHIRSHILYVYAYVFRIQIFENNL
jgi:hypothetical protein